MNQIIGKHAHIKKSNNPENVKICAFISQFYSSIMINTNVHDRKSFLRKFLKRMTKRGYHPGVVKKHFKVIL